MANCFKLVGQLPKNDVCLTQCYKMVHKEDVVSMIAENVKVHIGPRLLYDLKHKVASLKSVLE